MKPYRSRMHRLNYPEEDSSDPLTESEEESEEPSLSPRSERKRNLEEQAQRNERALKRMPTGILNPVGPDIGRMRMSNESTHEYLDRRQDVREDYVNYQRLRYEGAVSHFGADIDIDQVFEEAKARFPKGQPGARNAALAMIRQKVKEKKELNDAAALMRMAVEDDWIPGYVMPDERPTPMYKEDLAFEEGNDTEGPDGPEYNPYEFKPQGGEPLLDRFKDYYRE